jgi:alkaline phosphatase D
MDRRRFLAALSAASAYPLRASYAFRSYPFTLGIASGDPTPHGVVLWTRLAPEPLNGGGMEPVDVAVEWRVAHDEKMTNVVKRGETTARKDRGHAVHVEVRGLEPDRHYWYQFRAGKEWSPTGRTRTAPSAGAQPRELKFAFASCQHWEAGHFTAYQRMLEDDIGLVVHLGDYIYEGAAREQQVRRHNGHEIVSLDDYRNRYALYRTDPHLAKAHALFPWIVTWDDHEVDNNYADDKDQDGSPRERFLERRANAYQAYYEHMPLRSASLPRGSKLALYRRLSFGSLAEFSVLDTRQYRTDQPCGDGNKPQCREALDPGATLLGREQERWLLDGLDRSKARWNIVAQQVLMAKVDRMAGPGQAYAMDQWSGYEAARRRVLQFLAERKPSNPVVLTGDIHSNWVCDLKADYDRSDSAVVGTEFVGTSISSGGDGIDMQELVAKYLPENPHVKFYNSQRGYVRCSVTPEAFRADYRIVPYVTRPDAPLQTRASFVVENGRPGAQRL